MVTTSAAESPGALPGGTTANCADAAPDGTGSASGDRPASGFDECLVGSAGDAKSAITFDGTVVHQVTLSDSQMSFSLTSAEGSMTVQPETGGRMARDLQPGTGSVTYTCEGDTYTEEDGRGFHEVATRVT